MLYFSKLKLVAIYFIIIFLSLFSFSNFLETKNDHFLSKKVNLGLDLQGGSYLLLEMDIQPVVKQNLLPDEWIIVDDGDSEQQILDLLPPESKRYEHNIKYFGSCNDFKVWGMMLHNWYYLV